MTVVHRKWLTHALVDAYLRKLFREAEESLPYVVLSSSVNLVDDHDVTWKREGDMVHITLTMSQVARERYMLDGDTVWGTPVALNQTFTVLLSDILGEG